MWLATHRGHVPAAVWQKRLAEWTPEVSAEAWARLFAEQAGDEARVALLVAEDGTDDLVALVLGTEDEDDPSGSTARIDALYVCPDRQHRGIGRWLRQEVVGQLGGLGFSTLHIGVLTENVQARAFYEAMGGQKIGERIFDEDGVLLPGTVYGWSDITTVTRGRDQ